MSGAGRGGHTSEAEADRREGPDAARQIVSAELASLFYDELRALAAGYLRRERAGHTLQPTALVHEAFLRLVEAENLRDVDRAGFLAMAASAMRRVLVDHARARAAEKRGGDAERITLDSGLGPVPGPDLDVLALDEALARLAALDERQAKVVELRFFGGLAVEEVADVLGVSKRSVEADWTLARVWLRRALAAS